MRRLHKRLIRRTVIAQTVHYAIIFPNLVNPAMQLPKIFVIYILSLSCQVCLHIFSIGPSQVQIKV